MISVYLLLDSFVDSGLRYKSVLFMENSHARLSLLNVALSLKQRGRLASKLAGDP